MTEDDISSVIDYWSRVTDQPVAKATILRLLARVRELEAARDDARYNARVLAHAWNTDNRPPISIVRASLAYPRRPKGTP